MANPMLDRAKAGPSAAARASVMKGTRLSFDNQDLRRSSRVRALLRYAVVPVLMVVPFTGTAFLGDQRRYIYMFTNETGGDPWPLLERDVGPGRLLPVSRQLPTVGSALHGHGRGR